MPVPTAYSSPVTAVHPLQTTIPLIIGPTAGGKSALALGLARRLRSMGHAAELISADAYQVYRGMDIGTAKPDNAERDEFPHHLIDVCEPTETFTVHDWLRQTHEAIDAIRGRGGLPIVVGGTHLYAKALLDGLFEGPEPDAELRAKLEAQDGPTLRAQLERVDPQAALRIHPNDQRRTVRALEVYEQTGIPISQHQQQWDSPSASAGGEHAIKLVALDWETEAINRRINSRVREMVARGLVTEARHLWEAQVLGPTAREALGYKQLIAHFQGRCSEVEALEQTKIESRRFAKKQRTWIRRLRVFSGSVSVGGPELEEAQSLQVVVSKILDGIGLGG